MVMTKAPVISGIASRTASGASLCAMFRKGNTITTAIISEEKISRRGSGLRQR